VNGTNGSIKLMTEEKRINWPTKNNVVAHMLDNETIENIDEYCSKTNCGLHFNK
jgi:hypothetical protein